MPRPRFYRLPSERQRELLEIAANAFARDGFEGASYNQILEDIGLSKGSAYYTFEGKADLFAEVLRRELQAAMDAIPPPEIETDPQAYWDGMRGWFETSLRFADAHPRVVALTRAFLQAQSSGQLPPLTDELERLLAGWMKAAIVAGQAAGAVRSDLEIDLLASLVSATVGILDGDLFARGFPRSPAALEHAVELYLDTLKRLIERRAE